MLNTSILLFFEFFKVGLFTFGGGFGSLPFLYMMVDKYPWFSHGELLQLIAVSGITPGPIGLNMATFAGFKTLGLFGALISSLALVLPMIIITSQVFRLYRKFSENNYVKSILFVLRPTSCALICAVGLRLFYNLVFNNKIDFSAFDYRALVLILILFLMTFKFSRSPIIYMVFAGIFGIVLYFLGLL